MCQANRTKQGVAPLTWGGIIGNSSISLSSSRDRVSCRPINLGRNHWKLKPKTFRSLCTRVAPLTWGGIIGNDRRGRPLRELRSRVAPLTWGGIIGNRGQYGESVLLNMVAPLTWGGIIGNQRSIFKLVEVVIYCRPINLGRNHWKPESLRP